MGAIKRASSATKRTWMLGLALLTLTPSVVDAYVRTKTCDPLGDVGNLCQPGQVPLPVYWPDTCHTFVINRDGSDNFPVEEGDDFDPLLMDAILDSFEAWSFATCSNFEFAYGGLTCSRDVGFFSQDVSGNQNLVVWRDEDWEHASDTIALTTLSTDPETGEIRDADVEFNGVFFEFGFLASDRETALVDVSNTLTHEVGHMLGLDHERDIIESTMFPSSVGGEIYKRDLHPDDVQGLCSIYPGSGASQCTPTFQDDRTCTVELGGSVRCTHAPHHAPTPWHVPLAALAMLLVRARVRHPRLK